jgi:hypothetical protein
MVTRDVGSAVKPPHGTTIQLLILGSCLADSQLGPGLVDREAHRERMQLQEMHFGYLSSRRLASIFTLSQTDRHCRSSVLLSMGALGQALDGLNVAPSGDFDEG